MSDIAQVREGLGRCPLSERHRMMADTMRKHFNADVHLVTAPVGWHTSDNGHALGVVGQGELALALYMFLEERGQLDALTKKTLRRGKNG